MSELLIALAILGVIATFTIPKVLNAQQDSRFNSIAKENIGMVAGVYQNYVKDNGYNTAMTFTDLLKYINYVSIDSSGSEVDYCQGLATSVCNATTPCLKMHNGSTIRYHATQSFGGSATTNGLWFDIDPDGKVTDGTTNGPGKALGNRLYYNGMTMDWGNHHPNTYNSGSGPNNPNPARTPPWFSW